MKYRGWVRPKDVGEFRYWLFLIWNDYEKWHLGIEIHGVRVLGFEFC